MVSKQIVRNPALVEVAVVRRSGDASQTKKSRPESGVGDPNSGQ